MLQGYLFQKIRTTIQLTLKELCHSLLPFNLSLWKYNLHVNAFYWLASFSVLLQNLESETQQSGEKVIFENAKITKNGGK